VDVGANGRLTDPIDCCNNNNQVDHDDDDDDDDVTKAEIRKCGGAVGELDQQRQTKWASVDGYNLQAFDQTENVWPENHPLPLPMWSGKTKKTMTFEKVIFLLFRVVLG
jgi:hypothetical protein